MLKVVASALVAMMVLASPGYASKPKCTDLMTPNDVVAVDYDKDGNAIEYKRTEGAKIVEVLKAKIAADPAIAKSKEFEQKMLTVAYWATERCGGTKNCSTKECPNSKDSCKYGNIGMAGCRCTSS